MELDSFLPTYETSLSVALVEELESRSMQWWICIPQAAVCAWAN